MLKPSQYRTLKLLSQQTGVIQVSNRTALNKKGVLYVNERELHHLLYHGFLKAVVDGYVVREVVLTPKGKDALHKKPYDLSSKQFYSLYSISSRGGNVSMDDLPLPTARVLLRKNLLEKVEDNYQLSPEAWELLERIRPQFTIGQQVRVGTAAGIVFELVFTREGEPCYLVNFANEMPRWFLQKDLSHV